MPRKPRSKVGDDGDQQRAMGVRYWVADPSKEEVRMYRMRNGWLVASWSKELKLAAVAMYHALETEATATGFSTGAPEMVRVASNDLTIHAVKGYVEVSRQYDTDYAIFIGPNGADHAYIWLNSKLPDHDEFDDAEGGIAERED